MVETGIRKRGKREKEKEKEDKRSKAKGSCRPEESGAKFTNQRSHLHVYILLPVGRYIGIPPGLRLRLSKPK